MKVEENIFLFFFFKKSHAKRIARRRGRKKELERAKQSKALQNYRTMKSKITMIYFCLSMKKAERKTKTKELKIIALKTIIDACSSKIVVAFWFLLEKQN